MDLNNRIGHFFNQPTPELEQVSQPEPVPPTALEEKQAILSHFVRLVAHGLSHGLFVSGPGGLGKSKTIAETLTSEGIAPVLLNSHVTPLSLYRTLFHNRDNAVVWIDDADSLYSGLQALGLLRSALWGEGQRLVTYSSTQLPDDLPSQFVFSSRIIFCANVIPKRNEAFKAVLTRVDCFHLEATNEEIIEQMRKLAAVGSFPLTAEECHEVVSFIEQAGGTRRLSMRLYEPSLRKYEYALLHGIDWQDLVRCQLDQLGTGENVAKPVDSRSHDLDCLREAIRQFPNSVKEQQEFWMHATKKSRASFFRVKRAFEKGSNQ